MSLLDISETSILESQQIQEPTLDNAVSHNLLVECLKKEKKKLEDCEWIYESIKDIDFFKNMFASYQTEDAMKILLELCTKMSYESVRAGTFIFKQGDESNNKFYVILRGQVGVITAKGFKNLWPSRSTAKLTTTQSLSNLPPVKSDEKEELDNTKTDENPRPSVGRKATLRFGENFGTTVAMTMAVKKVAQRARLMLRTKNTSVQSLPNIDEEENSERDFKELAESHGQLVRVLHAGNDFGDAAFKKPGHKRTASILCKTDCELLVINAAGYINFLAAIREKKNQFLLNAFAFLNSINSSQIQYRIFYSFFSQGFNEGTMLTDEGQKMPNPKIYLIEHGTCKIQRKLEYQIKNPVNHTEVVHKQTQWLTLCVVGPGTLIGEETLFYPKNQEQYEYRIIVTSKKLSAMSISKQVFINLHPEMKEHVQKFYKVKKSQRDEVYESLSREALAQKEDNSHHFLKKHAGLMRMVNKKVLSHFTDRETRTSKQTINHVVSHESLPQMIPPENVDPQQKVSPNQSYFMSTHSTFGLKSAESMNQLHENKSKQRRNATIGSEQDLDKQTTVSRHHAPMKPVAESTGNVSFNKTQREYYQSGQISRLDRTKSLNLMPNVGDQSSIMRYDNEGEHTEEHLSEQMIANLNDQTLTDTTNRLKSASILSGHSKTGMNFSNMKGNQAVHLPIAYMKGPLQQIQSKQTQSIERLLPTQMQSSPIGKGNKTRATIRLVSSSQVLDFAAPRFRESTHERSWSNFLANLKTPEPQKSEDIEQYRFVFNDNADTQKRNRLRKMALARSQQFASFSHRFDGNAGKENSKPEMNSNTKRDQQDAQKRASVKESERCNSTTPFLTNLGGGQNAKPVVENQKQCSDRIVHVNNSTASATVIGISTVPSREYIAIGDCRSTGEGFPKAINQNSEQAKKMLQYKAKIQEISKLHRDTRKRIQSQNHNTTESKSFMQTGGQGSISLPKFYNPAARKNASQNHFSASSLVLDNQS